jgi:hypothetical protein
MIAGDNSLLPWIDDQSIQTMSDINQIAFEINQWHIQNRMQMDDNLFKMLLTILGRQPEE